MASTIRALASRYERRDVLSVSGTAAQMTTTSASRTSSTWPARTEPPPVCSSTSARSMTCDWTCAGRESTTTISNAPRRRRLKATEAPTPPAPPTSVTFTPGIVAAAGKKSNDFEYDPSFDEHHGSRRDVRRFPALRPHDAVLESRLDRDPVPLGAAGRHPVRPRAARGLGRRDGDGLGDRPERACARAAPHDRGPRQRRLRDRDRPRQPRARRGGRRPAGSPPSRVRAVPRGQARQARRRLSGVGRPARSCAGRAGLDRACRSRGDDAPRACARDRADERLGRACERRGGCRRRSRAAGNVCRP